MDQTENQQDVAGRIIQAAITVSSSPTVEEGSFSHILASTRASFRPQLQQRRLQAQSTNKRGRKRKATYQKKVFVVKLANVTFLPPPYEQKYLNKRGLGLLSKPLTINRTWSFEKIKMEILDLMLPNLRDMLEMVDFSIARCGKHKMLTKIDMLNTDPEDLEVTLGSGMLIVIPKRDFPYNLPLVEEPHLQILEDANSYSDEQGPPPQRRSFNRRVFTNQLSLNNSVVTNQQEPARKDEAYNDDFAYFSDIEDGGDVVDTSFTVSNELHPFLNFPRISEDSELVLIDVSRDNIVPYMFDLYSQKPSTVDNRFLVKFIGEDGVDGGGLLNELFSIFWREIFKSDDFFIGTNIVVPFVKLSKIREVKPKFVILGRILGHMILLTGKMPSRLALYTLTALSDKGDDYTLNEEMLLHDFFLFTTLPERRLMQKGLNNFNKLSEMEVNRLTSLYMTYGLSNVLPNEKDIKQHLLLLAENTLIKNTADLFKKMKEGVPKDIILYFTNLPLNFALNLWKSLQPTAEKVANCLKLQVSYPTNEQEKIFYFLQMYVLGLNTEELERFLLFVTATAQMPEQIAVDFHNEMGLARRPIISTCANLIKLSVAYDSQKEFSDEINAFLNSDAAFKYDTY
ncbi:unnamed protein product [Brassicogethes aeneus]|uniref:HECT domain-containing protein n=1 Tax=Brassicogethes aeneus TaxID=1431903 RepID=A0A9P0BJT0_BRAAE|nr:unnamed protein product [Brassicogethes aeneus]